MAEAKPPSTSDLLLLISGLQVVKKPDLKAGSGKDYYLNPPQLTEERTLRETTGNDKYIDNPFAAWRNVPFRDWLISTLFGNLTDHKHDFTTISEDVLYSIDILGKKFDRYGEGMSEAIKQAMLSAELKKDRTFYSTLTFGISQQQVGTKEVLLFGAGMRRRAELWLHDDEALQVDAEFFVPFLILPNKDHGKDVESSFVRSICAGIALRNTKEQALWPEKDKELFAMRFNFRIPFRAETQTEGDKELQTQFGTPEIKIQKKVKNALNWENFDGWKDFLKEYCDLTEVSDLLNSPMGPLLGEKISDGSGVKDLIFDKTKRDEITANLPRFKQDLDDTLYLLRHALEWQPPDKKDPEPHSGSRKLGSVLKSLGFMTGKPPSEGEIEYSFKLAENLTVWSILNRIIAELDGFPLYVSGLDSKKDKYNRIAVSLASQEDRSDSKKHYFGVSGLAYNILLNPVSKKDPAKDGDSGNPSIVLSKDNFTDDESILIDPEEEEKEDGGPKKEEIPPAKEEKSKVDVLLHLGKWFSSETLDDNWMLRLLPKTDQPGTQRMPLPGIRVLPFKRITTDDNTKANFSWTFLFDLLSLGIDIQGNTKDGLTFTQGLAGYFGLGAVELRFTFSLSLESINTKKTFFDRFAFGVGIKLKDMRLSLGPKEEDDKEKKKKESGDEIVKGLQELLADDWEVIPAPPKPKKPTVKTRLSAKKKDKFSISIGYLSPLKDGGNSTLDIQLYDDKGTRGKMVLIPIDRLGLVVYVKQIGIALKGVENLEIRKGLPDSAQMTVMLTGGLRLPVFELGFIGAKLTFQLNNPGIFKFSLDGLDVSVKFGSVVISGSFMKIGLEYAGSLTVSIPKGSFSAMGFYGSILLTEFAPETTTLTDLNLGIVPQKLESELRKKKIETSGPQPIRHGYTGGWELVAKDNKVYPIFENEGKFVVQRPEKTFFVYITLSAASGTGIPLGPIQITGLVFGYGYNRRVKIPTIENVADFPLVKIVMGQGGYQEEDESFELHKQLAKPVEDPIAILEKMKDHVLPELGSQFACGGIRFTISGTIDCFALIVVQWSEEEFEISLLGLARFRLPRDTTARALCYVEMQVLMTIKPKEGTFKLQALLSNNSWIINKDCKLTGGFAVFVWFDGDHKGDVVVTLGGYHPRFRRPEHYPVVPRLGLNWPVNDNLTIKGGCYYAFTPSCGMFGSRMEAIFHSGRISAWFTAYLDVVINWSPLFFEAQLGISLRVEARLFIKTFSFTISASIEMWGPPVGGIAHIDLTIVKFSIDFGTPRPKKPELIETWQKFCHNFLNLSGQDSRPVGDPVVAFPIVQPNLAAGRNNLNKLPNALRKDSKPTPEDSIWKVRPDELELAATAAVPVTTMNFGNVKNSSAPEGVQERSTSGRSMMVSTPLKLENDGLKTKNSANKLGAHPMGKGIQSVLNVTIVRDELSASEAVKVSDWTIEHEVGSLPAGLWEPGVPNMRPTEPTAKLIDGCITGIKRLKPPRGALGKKAAPPPIEWHQLPIEKVPKPTTPQEKPSAKAGRNIQTVVAEKQNVQKDLVAALASIGFSLTWKPVPQTEVLFRELQADPLAGAVAA